MGGGWRGPGGLLGELAREARSSASSGTAPDAIIAALTSAELGSLGSPLLDFESQIWTFSRTVLTSPFSVPIPNIFENCSNVYCCKFPYIVYSNKFIESCKMHALLFLFKLFYEIISLWNI